MGFPWRNNQKLIDALFEELNEVKGHIQKLEKENEFLKRMEALRTDITTDIVRELDTERIAKKISDNLCKDSKKSKTGLI